MLSLALAASWLVIGPPELPADDVSEPSAAEVIVVDPSAASTSAEPSPAPESPAAVEPVPDPVPDPVPEPGALPLAPELGGPAIVIPSGSVVIVDASQPNRIDALGPRMQAVPPVPYSGAGRFVGGAVSLLGGVGLLTAASFEFSDGRDTTKPLISQLPAAIVMLVAGGTMIGTAARDQNRLAEWEAATRIDAKPMGTGLIVGGVSSITLGSLAAIATSIAVDMDLDAPRSIPAGWATAGVAIAGGTGMLIAGIVRRVDYGRWRKRVTGAPMVAPTRAGATIGFVGQF